LGERELEVFSDHRVEAVDEHDEHEAFRWQEKNLGLLQNFRLAALEGLWIDVVDAVGDDRDCVARCELRKIVEKINNNLKMFKNEEKIFKILKN
jgi:hypothetical protein